MPSIDALAVAIRIAIDQNHDLIARLDASRAQATELRAELGTLSVEAKAAKAASIVDNLEELQTEASTIRLE